MAGVLLPSAAPPAPVQRPRVVMVATTFVSVGCAMFFAGLLGVYLTQRSVALANGLAWIPDKVSIPLAQPHMMMVTLLMSSITVQWAVDAIRRDDRRNAYVAFGITLLLGIAFINMLAYLNSLLHLDVASPAPVAVLYYVITGAHLVMLLTAMLFVGLMAFRALGGQYTSRQHDGVSAAALYWHTMVAVFAIVWYAIYIVK